MRLKKELRHNIYLFRIPYIKDIYGFCRDFVNMTYYVNMNQEQGYETFYNSPDKTYHI